MRCLSVDKALVRNRQPSATLDPFFIGRHPLDASRFGFPAEQTLSLTTSSAHPLFLTMTQPHIEENNRTTMIAPPRSPSGGRSSSRTVELRDLGRTGLRPTRRHTSQMLVGYAVPSAVTPRSGNAGASVPVNANNLSPPQSGRVAISTPIIEESSTASPPAEQLSPPSTYDPQQPSSSILNPEGPSVIEGTWAKISAIATLYQAFLATIQTAGGIAFGAATVVLAVKGLQLMQLEYCEGHKVGLTAPCYTTTC